MMKNWENNGTEEIGLVTPTPGQVHLMYVIARCDDKHTEQQTSINTSSYHSEFSQTGSRGAFENSKKFIAIWENTRYINPDKYQGIFGMWEGNAYERFTRNVGIVHI